MFLATKMYSIYLHTTLIATYHFLSVKLQFSSQQWFVVYTDNQEVVLGEDTRVEFYNFLFCYFSCEICVRYNLYIKCRYSVV